MKQTLCILTAACLAAVCFTSCSDNSDSSENEFTSSKVTSSENDIASGSDDTSENIVPVVLSPLTAPQTELRSLNSKQSVPDNSVYMKNTTESGRVLYAEETDTLFRADNKYLYQQTGGESFALAEGIFCSLNLMNGKLYFISSETAAAVQPMRGTPYMLDLDTGELTMLSDKTTSAIYVQSERIFLEHWESYIDESGKTKGRYFYCQCEPNGASAEMRSDIILCTNGDWYVTCEQDETTFNIFYRNDKENVKTLLTVESYLPKKASIYEDNLYYVEGSWGDVFKCTPLDGGETSVCDTKRNYIQDYTFVDGKPTLLTDRGFGTVDENMIYDCAYITFDDNNVKNFYSVYNYNGEVIATVKGGYQLLTMRNNASCFSSAYSFS